MASGSPRNNKGIWRILAVAAVFIRCGVSWRDELAGRLEDLFEEVALQRMLAEDFHVQVRPSNKGPQNPANLAAEEQVAGEPGEHDLPGRERASTQRLQEGQQSHVRHHAGEGNREYEREFHEAVAQQGRL